MQQRATVKGTLGKAQDQLRDMLEKRDKGTLTEPSKLTLGAWLREWLDSAKHQMRPATAVRYAGIIGQMQATPMAAMKLQQIRRTHIEAYYTSLRNERKLSASTQTLHHVILSQAFHKAVRDNLVATNPTLDLDKTVKPKRSRDKGEEARHHCWTASEVQQFLTAAKEAGEQPAAFYTLALDSGMRKGELCGLDWNDIDVDAGKVRVVRTLLSPTLDKDGKVQTGPTKTGKPRTVALSAGTVTLLRAWRQAQREQMMAHRPTFTDFGLVFTSDDGSPLQMNNLGQREYSTLIKTAGVKPIRFHGLRHTCATLLLQAGVPVKVVSERLGHAKVTMTLEVYAHVLPEMQEQAASVMGGILGG